MKPKCIPHVLYADSQLIYKICNKLTFPWFIFFYLQKKEIESQLFPQGVGAECLLLKNVKMSGLSS
jgi:hypothetical protein